MPRTSVTARMTTGGTAKRVTLTQQVVTSDVQMQEPTSPLNLQHCSMCSDGGELWECDEPDCGRAVCSNCVEIPAEARSKLSGPNVRFTCVRCNWSWNEKNDRNDPYFGFTVNGKPVLKTFLKVKGGFEASIGATVHSPPTILLHFRLHSICNNAHFTIVNELLSEYYSNDNRLEVIDLPFNVGWNQAVAKWNKDAQKLIAKLSGFRHVIAFITTHSTPVDGDLWLGTDEEDEACAAPVGDWINIILGPFKSILSGSILFMLACGAIVDHPNSFGALRQGLASFGVADALAFNAPSLSTVNTVDLLTKVTKSVVIHGFKFTEALEHTLKQCLTLGKHTAVIHITPQCVTKYLWAHKKYQPWGEKLSLQCSQCGILNPWLLAYVKDSQAYGIECKNPHCGRDSKTPKERKSFSVARPEGSILLSSGKEAGWLKIIVD